MYAVDTCQTPAPGPYVREMLDAGMFYSNRVLKEFKEKYVVCMTCLVYYIE